MSRRDEQVRSAKRGMSKRDEGRPKWPQRVAHRGDRVPGSPVAVRSRERSERQEGDQAGRAVSAKVAANQLFVVDRKRLNVKMRLPEDAPPGDKRPFLVVVMDAFSRTVAGLAVSFAMPNRMTFEAVVRRACRPRSLPGWPNCGRPDVVRYEPEQFLGSTHLPACFPGEDFSVLPWPENGPPPGYGAITERFFRLLPPSAVDHETRVENGGGGEELTLEELEAHLRRYISQVYHRTPHPVTGEPPAERWKRSLRGRGTTLQVRP